MFAPPISALPGEELSTKMDWFGRLAMQTAALSGKPAAFLAALVVVAVWGLTGLLFHLQRYLAARDQHRYHDRDLSDGVFDPCHAEPRHARLADQAVRIDPGVGRSAQ
jgi:hypothetical protein